MTTDELRVIVQRIRDDADAVLASLPPPFVLVRAGENLQAALDAGGAIQLEAGATYEGTFIVRKPVAVMGNGATLHGLTGPALIVEPGTTDVSLTDLSGRSDDVQRVFLLGYNEAAKQGTLDAVPRRITLTDVRVPTFRGKRAFEVNSADVTFYDCHVEDVYAPSLQDSQAICILNSPGSIDVIGCTLSAGSEAFLVGGSLPAIPGLVPENIIVEDSTLYRPLSWRTDGVKRAVKNLFELKTGRNVTLRGCTLDGSWLDAQEGFGVMLTPHAGGEIHDVTIEDCEIRHVSGGLNVLGREYAITSPETVNPTSGVVMRRCHVTTDRATFGGRGMFALIGGEPADLTLEDNVGIVDGTSCVYVYAGNVVKHGVSVEAGPVQALTLTGNRLVAGKYGVALNNLVTSARIEGNTFADAPSTLKSAWPSNTFVTRAEFDALVG